MEVSILMAIIMSGVFGVLGYFYAKHKAQTEVTAAKLKEQIAENQLEEYERRLLAQGEQLQELAELKTQQAAGAVKLQWQEKALKETQASLAETENKLQASLEQNKQLEHTHTELQANWKHTQQKQQEFKQEVEQMQQRMKIQFESFSGKLIEENRTKLSKENEERLSLILNPLKNNLKDFEKKVQETYTQEVKERASLKVELKHLIDLNQQLSTEANNLATALKGDTQKQGTWGEFILETVLENSGLRKGKQYVVQESTQNDEGKTYRPDVVVKYPGDKHIVIDSKLSLNAYERSVNAASQQEQEAEWRAHLTAVKTHIDQLSAKKYEQLYGVRSLDFVFMFVPLEGAFIQTLHDREGLWQYAYEKKILLISPTNLISALKLIHNLWQQEQQSRNVQEIAAQAGKLHDKFVGLLTDLHDVGDKIGKARESYDKAMNKLSTGRGNLVGHVAKLKQLGASAKKTIPQNLLEE